MKKISWIEVLSAGLAVLTSNALFSLLHLHLGGRVPLVLLIGSNIVGALSVYRSIFICCYSVSNTPLTIQAVHSNK